MTSWQDDERSRPLEISTGGGSVFPVPEAGPSGFGRVGALGGRNRRTQASGTNVQSAPQFETGA